MYPAPTVAMSVPTSRVALAVVAVIAVVALGGCLSVGAGQDGGDVTPSTTQMSDPTTGEVSDDPTQPSSDAGQSATVTRVIDGDTVEVELADGTVEKVRLIGVDTPEVYSENTPDEYGVPDTQAGRDCLGRYGERASEFAIEQLEGEQVRIVPDENLDERGYYGRLLAYVYVDGESFNYRLIETGYARVFESDFTRRGTYEDTQRVAREADRGLWACATDTDAGTTESESGLSLVAVNADAEGRDGENLDDEYLVFENAGTESLSLGGWTVSDASGATYTFPDVTLAPGERITLRTGAGTDTETDLYWGASRPVWNNAGDTVTVTDESGAVVLQESY